MTVKAADSDYISIWMATNVWEEADGGGGGGWKFMSASTQSSKLHKHEFTFSYRIAFWIQFSLPASFRLSCWRARETSDNGDRLVAFLTLRFFCWPFGGNIDFHVRPSASTPSAATVSTFASFLCHREGEIRDGKQEDENECWVLKVYAVASAAALATEPRQFTSQISRVQLWPCFSSKTELSRTWDATSTFCVYESAAQKSDCRTTIRDERGKSKKNSQKSREMGIRQLELFIYFRRGGVGNWNSRRMPSHELKAFAGILIAISKYWVAQSSLRLR